MFVPSLGLLVRMALVVGGIYWCKEVFERFRKDISELRGEGDAVQKSVIVFIWIVTAGILYLLVRYAFFLLQRIHWGLAHM
ncbi:MAG: hypothetical protein ACYTAN_13505 [Planctomycetota bacterium]|jgi:nicotinate-nucleotide pyrophosphorylase